MNKKLIISALFALTLAFGANARPARRNVQLQQPDGSSICALLSGDERMHVLTDQQGHALVQGQDGFYMLARYNSDGSMVNTGFRADGKGGETPAHVLRESSYIPYEAIVLKAGERTRISAQARSRRAPMRTRAAESAKATPIPMNCLVIFAAYSDIPFTYSRSQLADVFCKEGYSYKGANGSVTDYFQDQLKGEMDCGFTPGPMVNLPNKQKYYGGNDANGNDQRAEEAVADACRLAKEAGVDFSQFDLDGDGDVDNVFIIASGKDEADGGGDNAIWAHQWYLADAAGVNLVLDGKRINSYTICSELSYRFNGNYFDVATIGAICHEYSHSLGLMDMYDTDGQYGGDTDGLYYSSLMCIGCYNDDSNTPSGYMAIDYDTLEMGEVEDLTPGKYAIDPIQKGHKYYRIRKPGEPQEYFLIEYRNGEDWDIDIDGKGLAVYHVDHSKRKAGYSASYQMTLTAEQRWYYNEVNARQDNMCAAFVASKSKITDNAQLFFPNGSTNELTPDSAVPLCFFDGTPSPIYLTQIRLEGGKACFTALDGSDFLIPEITEVACDSYQHCAVLTTSLSKSTFGGKCLVRWGAKGNRLISEEAVKIDEDGSFVLRMEDLQPGNEYEYNVRLSASSVEGDPVSGSFRTEDSKGTQSYIFLGNVERNADKSIKRGAKIPLDIYDMPTADEISWYFDGREVKCANGGYFQIDRSGILSATFKHADGSTETITKTITAR